MLGRCLRSSVPTRAYFRRPSLGPPRWGFRGVHERVPTLDHLLREGLGDFLPPQALKALAVEYQEGLLQRLNNEIEGVEGFEGQSVAKTIEMASHKMENALIFNYASLALNNHFFLAHLASPPKEIGHNQDAISPLLRRSIEEQHGSLAHLKSAFSAAALGMFSSGYLWFVTDTLGNTSVIPTFGPGTLLVRSRSYIAGQQDILNELFDPRLLDHHKYSNPMLSMSDSVYAEESLAEDLDILLQEGHSVEEAAEAISKETAYDVELTEENEESESDPPSPTTPTPTSPVSGLSYGDRDPKPPPGSRAYHSTTVVAAATDFVNNRPSDVDDDYPSTMPIVDPKDMPGRVLYPLFCLPIHEQAWMSAGYGIWGKEAWIKEFWLFVNWEMVSEVYAQIVAPLPNTSSTKA